jgi:hypothetical protein
MRAPMNALYMQSTRIHDGDWFAVWRVGHTMGVRIAGELDDERNPVWRAKVDELWARDGAPRFMALDVREAIPAASLPRRMQTAAWGRRVLATIEHGTLAVGKEARVGLTVGAIMRVVGMTNVFLRNDEAAFDRDVEAMLRGERPSLMSRSEA